LFVETGSATVHIAEMAHIIAATDGGPRADATVSGKDRGAYENLILLCANCHTLIDKAPDDFPDPLVRGWKKTHSDRIQQAFGLMPYPDRSGARAAVEQLLRQNYHVFMQLGPDNDYRYDPESDQALVWQRKMLSVILPNNRKILGIADANRRHMSEKEQACVEAFRQHVDDLETKHVAGGNDPASRFPTEMRDLFA
jgi:hypothetical protein